MNAFASVEQNGKASGFSAGARALFQRQSRSEVKGATSISSTFLRVTVAC
jgi:hypothetical protein